MKLFLLLSAFCLSSTAQITRSTLDENPPLIEFGVGLITLSMPDYPGAERSQTYTFPFPTVLYRGDILRADQEGGARARFIQHPDYELSFSGSLTFSSKSSENPARMGMPDLDGLGEFGPSLIWRIKKASKENLWKINLSIPLRYAVSTDFSQVDGRGFVFNPFLFAFREKFLHPNLILFAGIDTRFATESYMDYYYQVDPQYVTSSRPYYDAQGGYLQSSTLIGLSYRLKKHTLFTGFQYLDLHGSRNEDSPLLVKKSQTSWVLGYTFWFYESDYIGSRY